MPADSTAADPRSRDRNTCSGNGPIDLNADVGEGFAEANLLPALTSASIACAEHAGDDETMRRTIESAQRLGLSIGAHPGFADREGFGRRITTRDPEAIADLVARQVGRLRDAAREFGASARFVKPHGALYNLASAEPGVAFAIASGAERALPGVTIVLAAGSPGLEALANAGMATVAEAFVDRAYRRDGTLVPRSASGARIDDPEIAARQAVGLALDGRIVSIDGTVLDLRPRTLCVHGDTPGSATIAHRVRAALRDAGMEIRGFVRANFD